MLAITFRNISNLAEISDYEYTVLIGGGDRTRVLETGLVRGHRRKDGWDLRVITGLDICACKKSLAVL
jgi:hypothetical protein